MEQAEAEWAPGRVADGAKPVTRVDAAAVESIERIRAEGAAFPRIGLFLFGCPDPDTLIQVLDRIPKPADEWLAELVVMCEPGAAAWSDQPCPTPRSGRALPLRLHREPRDYGHGGARKAAFESALRSRLDLVVVMRGDGTHPPEALPALLQPALVDGRPVVFASRRGERRGSGMSITRALAHALAAGLQNRVLGLRQRDYLSSFRVYATEALACVPFQLDSNDRSFDVELAIQLRALGTAVCEVTVGRAWREGPSARDELAHVWRALRAAVDYRLHQLHLTRDGRYLVDHGIHYTLKHSVTGSHMQIVDAIAPGSRVLDLGCSQGLLARPLREKQVRVSGVDAGAPHRLAEELEEYFRRDLEEPLELPTGRVYDYVVVADVIEHLRNRQHLLRSARRFLREDGRLLISTPNVALWFYRLSLLVGRFEYGPRGVLDRTHVHLYTRATFRREVERAGFHVLGERVTALPFEVVFESTGRSRLVRALAEGYHALARLWPEMFAYQFILDAEITTLDEEASHRPALEGD